MDLALKTRQRLNSQSTRTEVRIASESGKTSPIIVNSGYEIRKTDRYIFYGVCLECRVGELHLHSTRLLFITHHRLGVKQFSESKKNIFLDKMKHIVNVLYELDIYKPYRIIDKMMGVENKSHTRKFPTEAPRSPLSIGKISFTFLGFLNFQFLFTTTS